MNKYKPKKNRTKKHKKRYRKESPAFPILNAAIKTYEKTKSLKKTKKVLREKSLTKARKLFGSLINY